MNSPDSLPIDLSQDLWFPFRTKLNTQLRFLIFSRLGRKSFPKNGFGDRQNEKQFENWIYNENNQLKIKLCLIGHNLSQADANSTGGDSGTGRNQSQTGSGCYRNYDSFTARQRRIGSGAQPQGIRPDSPPPTRSLLLDFAPPEQEANDQEPLTKSPPGYSSSVSLQNFPPFFQKFWNWFSRGFSLT